jgi:hypothetical protein
MATLRPAIKMNTVRGGPGFEAAVRLTDADPVPVPAPGPVIHVGRRDTFHEQEEAVWITLLAVPPEAGIVRFCESNE